MPRLSRNPPRNIPRSVEEPAEEIEAIGEPIEEPAEEIEAVQEDCEAVENESIEQPSSQCSQDNEESISSVKELFKDYFIIREIPNKRFINKLTELERDEEGCVLYPLFESACSWKFHWYA